jgi:2-polyprenyl-6-methoxyphenol hydroxylase-like FAD-dependent oxidoreductase
MNVIVIGGGICGLGTALLLARDGHDVTILERDADPVPASALAAWDGWGRKGVAQFRQPHNFMPGLRLLLEAELPDVQEALRLAGAATYDLLNPMPSSFADRSPRPIDESLWTYTARRPVGEWVFAEAAQREKGVTIRRGAQVAGFVAGPDAVAGTPHVAGIRTTGGEVLRADLVIDASGRQSRNVQWLTAAGARAPYEEQSDSGFGYYTRYFSGTLPQRRAPSLTPLGTISMLTLPGDNDTWSVTVFAAAGDQPLKELRHEGKWTNTVRACPLHAHWLEGEPITGVLAMSGVVDRYRRYVLDGAPVATGFAAVADAWACTNPSAGRGLTVGFLHALRLRDVLRETIDDPRRLVEQFDAVTEADIAPWYRAQIATDRARFAEMEALRAGREPGPPADALAAAIIGLLSLLGADADLFRAGLEYIATLTPVQEILQRPAVVERMQAVTASLKDAPQVRFPGPDRRQLLELLQAPSSPTT